MRTLLRSTLVVLVLGAASQASAGDKVWSVPGVVDIDVATAISCTNGSSVAATVKVEVFDAANVAACDVGNASIPSGESKTFATRAMLNFSGEINLLCANIYGGRAQITASSGVYCAAYVTDPVNSPPTTMMALPVIKKTSQKGD